jgi:hypothetical protein
MNLGVLSPYRKTIVAVAGALVTWVAATQAGDWVTLVTGIATALGVYGISNDAD